MSLDSLLLANFVTINLRDKNILDIATGNAPIPMLLTYRTKAKIYGIEIQKEIYDLGVKSIIVNHMDKQIEIINDDAKNACILFGDDYLNINDVFVISKRLLKTNGRLAIVHRTDRFIEIVDMAKKYGFSIKKVRFIYPKVGKNSDLVLIECTKNGKNGLKLLSPLFVYDEDGNYNSEIKMMFGDDTNDTK